MTEPEAPTGASADESSAKPVDSSRAAELRQQLDAAILGLPAEHTAEEVAATAGVDLDDARRLWRSLGFPEAGAAPAFTQDDVGALTLIRRVHEAGLDMDMLVRMTRAVGTTMSRLADWQVGNLAGVVDARGPGVEGRLESAIGLVDALAPNFELLLLYAWRRHLAASLARAEALQSGDDEVHLTATIGFADLVSFSALTNELDEDEIGDLVEVFEMRAHDIIAGHGGRIIKSLGDSVLFVAEQAPQGIDIALDVVAVIGGDKRLPDVHVGVATGPSVQRMGDVFGPAVNLAARLTTVARRNRVVIDQDTADLLPVADFETRRLPARPIRGFGDLAPLTVRRTRPRHRIDD